MPARPRVVIIGAGAAGVFTAYRLRQQHGDAFEIVLLEKSDRIGGNALTTTLDFGGQPYSIDCGAQFFYKKTQASYVKLIGELGLTSAPSAIESRATGITLWDAGANARRLWIPSQADGFLRYQPDDWSRLIAFTTFLTYAFFLDRDPSNDWTQSVDDWIGELALVDSAFKDQVLRPFLYQFVTLPSNRIGEASARYAITYFVRNVFGEPGPNVTPHVARPGGAPTFEVYQSRIGLDGVLKKALEASGVTSRLNEPVLAVARNADGTLAVTTTSETIAADHVVLATDPPTSAAILTAGSFPRPGLIGALQQCEYAPLPIAMQNGNPGWMPGDAEYWEAVNTVVDGDALSFSVWFGPLRDAFAGDQRIPVFKSWASPALDPSASPATFFSHTHHILMPTTTFMAARGAVLARQGQDNLWFAGGWTTWFDSQEAALDSATVVALALGGPPAAAARRSDVTTPPLTDAQDAIEGWLARAVAHAPDAYRRRLLRVVAEVESKG